MSRTLCFLALSVLALVTVGLLVLASAGGVNGMRLYNDPTHFLVRQFFWFALAIPCFLTTTFLDYHVWRKHRWLMVGAFLFITLLMGLVLLQPATKGSSRWLVLGPIRVQPSELAKLMVVLSLAVFLDHVGWRIKKFRSCVVPASGMVALLILLALFEPDFGTAFIMAATTLILFLVSGVRWAHLGLCLVAGFGFIGTMLAFNPNRMNRILSWTKDTLNALHWSGLASLISSGSAQTTPSAKELNAAYQSNMSLVALHNGGAFGVGYNQSMQKRAYLPEAHTDFIFAVGAEEWGLIFSLGILLLFLIFFICAMIVASHAPDRLGRLIAYGMAFLIFFEALWNIAVVTKCAPTKGLALPFISYGGTNLISSLLAVGFIFNVGRHTLFTRPGKARFQRT